MTNPVPATQPRQASNPVTVHNVRIFDGINGWPKPGNVLISDRKIKQISSGPIIPPSSSTVIDGGGHVPSP
jgi:dihydroorotase-like cyclic amidohydrolase